jgi:hypothetical protein
MLGKTTPVPQALFGRQKMPSQNNDLALLGIKAKFDNQCVINLIVGNLCL